MIQGPDRHTWDISIRKYFFTLTRRVRMNVRTDVFNVFNRLNYMNPNITTTSGGFTAASPTPGRRGRCSSVCA